jgi:Flp pilus assembly protein TadD
VVEFSRTHPREERSLLKMLEFHKPDFIVLRHNEFRKTIGLPWFEKEYRIVSTYEVPYDRNDPLFKSPNVDLGFLVFAKNTWHPGVTEYNGEPIGINPKHGGALNLEGFRLWSLGRLEEAKDFFARSIAANPGIIEARNNLGMVLTNQNRYDEALAQFRKVVELDPGCAAAYNNIGMLLAARGDGSGALKNLRESLRCDPGYVEALVNLASLLASRGNLPEARQLLESALKIQPDNATAREGLKGIAALSGK